MKSKPFSDSYAGRLRRKIGHDLLMFPGVRMVIEDREGRVLLQKRADFGVWGLPAGTPEVGETASEAIKREVLEETGLVVTGLGCFGQSSDPDYETFTYPNGDRVHSFAMLFYATAWEGELSTADDETLALQFYDFDALPEMIRNHRRTLDIYTQFKKTGKIHFD